MECVAVVDYQHTIHFYQANEQYLINNAARYVSEGLHHDEGVLVIAGPEHRRAFARAMTFSGGAWQSAVSRRQLLVFDAAEMLSRFIINGRPDPVLFESTLRDAMGRLPDAFQQTRIRIYGEMVGLLWSAGQISAAIEVEEAGNRLLAPAGAKVYCGYPIDIFAHMDAESVTRLVHAHTHIAPVGEDGDLEAALDRALAEALGPEAESLIHRLDGAMSRSWAVMPRAEGRILSLGTAANEPPHDLLARTRRHYRSEKRFRALLENSSDAISLLDREGAVTYASPSTTRVLGYAPAEILGRSSVEFIHPEDTSQARRALTRAVAIPRSPVQLQLRVRHKGGQWRWIEGVLSNLLDDPDIRALVANYRDISDRKAAEQRMRRDAQELHRCNAELKALAFAAAHDLKEPLRTICAFAQLLNEDRQVDASQREEYAGFVASSAKRMASLLDDLLAFTESGVRHETQTLELTSVVEQALSNLATSIEESGAAIIVDALPAVVGDETRLVRVFQNLISNAIKYRSDAPVEIRITSERAAGGWTIKVTDNGIGIPPKYHDHVFGLFKRLHDRRTPGTGVGLAICRKIIEEMGGRIWVESQPGRGSTFLFTLGAESIPTAAMHAARPV